MDTSEKDKFEVEKRNESLSDYCPPSSMSSGWQFSGSDVTSSHLGLIHSDRQMPVGRVDFVSNSASMVDSFAPVSWDQLSGLKNLGVGDAQNTASTSNIVGIRDGGLNSLRNVIGGRMDMNWNSPNMMLGGAIFLPNAPGMMPHCLSNLSADPAFIERAAKFSCFSGGPFADTMKPLGIHESMDLYSRCGSMIQGSQEIFAVGGSKSTSCGQTQRNVANTAEPSKASPLSADHRNEGSTAQILRQREFIQGSHDERNQCSVGSDNESDEANSSGGDGNSGDASAKKHRSKKRKRVGQENELEQANDTQKSGEAASDNPEILQKADNTPTSTPNKITGEQSQKATQVLDSPKGYIHVRARRGQATNSHSLAERVRREKISERMKFLQDLVPGCSKVTGKAVMLDEIINYVQSLQRQVEFLSMKLATVNPRLDLNIESLLAKDILQSQGLPSSTLAFPPGMPTGFPHLHSSQPGLIQPVFPPMDGNSSLLQRTIHSQLPPITVGFKEPAQLPNVWNDELHNVVQMSYATTASQDNHVATEAGLPPSSHMKIEL